MPSHNPPSNTKNKKPLHPKPIKNKNKIILTHQSKKTTIVDELLTIYFLFKIIQQNK